MTTETITMSNVRYITGSAKKVEKKLVAQKMLVFAETKAKLKTVIDKMIVGGLKPVDEPTEHKTHMFNGWDISKTKFSQTFITKTRQDFQLVFKKAKRAAMDASKAALALALAAKVEPKVAEVKPAKPAKKPDAKSISKIIAADTKK